MSDAIGSAPSVDTGEARAVLAAEVEAAFTRAQAAVDRFAAYHAALSCSPGEPAPASKPDLPLNLLRAMSSHFDAAVHLHRGRDDDASVALQPNELVLVADALRFALAAGEPAPEPQPCEDGCGKPATTTRVSIGAGRVFHLCKDAATAWDHLGSVPVAEPQTVEPARKLPRCVRTRMPDGGWSTSCGRLMLLWPRDEVCCEKCGGIAISAGSEAAQPSTSQSAEMTFLIGTVDASGLVPSTSEAPAAVHEFMASQHDLPAEDAQLLYDNRESMYEVEAPAVETADPETLMDVARRFVECSGPNEWVSRFAAALASSPQPDAPPLDEVTRMRDGYEREIARLEAEIQQQREVLAGNFWMWQGDGEDHLESLTCPVVIAPDVLAKLVQPDTPPPACGRCGTHGWEWRLTGSLLGCSRCMASPTDARVVQPGAPVQEERRPEAWLLEVKRKGRTRALLYALCDEDEVFAERDSHRRLGNEAEAYPLVRASRSTPTEEPSEEPS